MAYKRKRTMRRRAPRRSMRKRSSVSTFNSRTPLSKQLTLKIFDMVGVKKTFLVLDTTYFGYRDPLNLVQEGTTLYQRVGRTICMKSLHLKYFVAPATQATGTALPLALRVLVFYDHQGNGAATTAGVVGAGTTPTITQLLQSNGNIATAAGSSGTQVASTNVTDVYSGQNPDNYERFKILYDKTHVFPPMSSATVAIAGPPTSTSPSNCFVNKRISLKNLETKYTTSGLAGGAGEITTGTLWILAFGNYLLGTTDNALGAIATGDAQISYSTRLVYKD